MNDGLFGPIDSRVDPDWLIKEFFDSMYTQNAFLWALARIQKKSDFGVNEDYCNFLDGESSEVELGLFDESQIFTYDVFQKFLKIACEKYLIVRPEDTYKVSRVLAELSLSRS